MNKIRVGIVGVSGYSGRELLISLSNHPNIEIVYVAATTETASTHDLWPDYKDQILDLPVVAHSSEAVSESKAECVFLATPHGVSQELASELIDQGLRVIDLSGDFRLSDVEEFEKWYKIPHQSPELLESAVYGLSEIYPEQIKKAQLLANPGCYPTASILGIAPLAALAQSIHVDAKSGVSGAGIKNAASLLEDNKDSFLAYKVLNHQHAPEISQYSSQIAGHNIRVAFVPHLLPIERGIFATIYVNLKDKTSLDEIHNKYAEFYSGKEFIKLLPAGESPKLIDAVKTNNAIFGVHYDENLDLAVITVAIDNLVKGASGQAVQNFNLMYGFDETTALETHYD